VLAIIVIAAIVSPSDDDGAVVAGTTSTAPPTTTAATVATTAATTSTSTTTTTVAPTTTTIPPTTTTTVFTAEMQQARVVALFETQRLGLVKAIEDSYPITVERVDRLELDPAIPAYVIDITSGYSTASYQDDLAWDLTGDLAVLWEAATLAATPLFHPGLHLTIDGRGHSCTADFMAQLAERRATRADWDAAC